DVANEPLGDVVRRALSRLAGTADETDGRLLNRYVTQRDQAAFAELVRRHGPMVLRVCQRGLHHAQDAEDAFQAAFIVFARKAGTISRGGLVGGWLHGVACRVALQARDRTTKRRGHERAFAATQSPETARPDAGTAQQEIAAVFDEELNRLPDRYRQ